MDAAPVQVHIKQAGKSKMLFNKVKLQGIAPKIQKLAIREGDVSIEARDGPAEPNVRHAKPTTALPPTAEEDAQEVQLEAVPPQSGKPSHKQVFAGDPKKRLHVLPGNRCMASYVCLATRCALQQEEQQLVQIREVRQMAPPPRSGLCRIQRPLSGKGHANEWSMQVFCGVVWSTPFLSALLYNVLWQICTLTFVITAW